MKKYKSSLKPLFVILAIVFILNMLIMYLIFDINILNPRNLLQAELKTAEAGSNELKTAVLETKADEKSTLWEDSLANQAETNKIPKSGVMDTAQYYMTTDEITYLGHLGLGDKLLVMSILSKLGAEEVDRIAEMSHDGVTIAEFADINASIESELAVSDVEALKEILYKGKMLYAENGR